VFSGSFAYVAPVAFGVSLGGGAERTWGQLVTPSYFTTLGIRPQFGRFFEAADEQPGRAPTVVVSHRMWESRLGSDPSIVGRTIDVNGYPATVIGVGPEKFLGASPAMFPADVCLPVSVDGRLAPEMADHALERRDLTMFQVVGRLRPGIAESRAKIELNAAAERLARAYGELDGNQKAKRVELLQGGKILPVQKRDMPFFRDFFIILGGLVLLIACASVANMMLSRAGVRRKEISVRLALGAGRGRLVRQLLTESLVLSVGAALPAFLLSCWLMRLASSMKMPLPIPAAFDLTPDWRALAFTFVLTGVTGLGLGLAPALQATRADLVSALKEDGRPTHAAAVNRIPRAGDTEHGGGAGRLRSAESLPDFPGPGARRLFRPPRGGVLRQAVIPRQGSRGRDLRVPDGYPAGGHRRQLRRALLQRRPESRG